MKNNTHIRLKTAYETGEVPFPEYPRPQKRRDSFFNLNGRWNLTVIRENSEENYEILVPFAPESLNSGLPEGFRLGNEDVLVYSRDFSLTDEFSTGRALLNFGAVDYRAVVKVNGIEVGEHVGGYTPFTLDVTDAVKVGENSIEVRVTDSTEGHRGARGKQLSEHGGIWYTPSSGITGTVFLERVPDKYIGDFTIDTTDGVRVYVDEEEIVEYEVFDDGKKILSGKGVGELVFDYDFSYWSPEDPKLYDFTLKMGDDKIYSYFGRRTFGEGVDSNGKKRLLLNGRPYFFSGLLDQGYWSDGLLTPPSDRAMEDELRAVKEMGFNTLRKHIKIEPLRWYYHCDRLGIVVWQDFVNGGDKYKFSHIGLQPFFGVNHPDHDYEYFGRSDEKGRLEFIRDMIDTVDALKNCTCISLWTIFNEGWGQFDSARMTEMLCALDSTRVIDAVSGWHDQGESVTPIKSLHTYFTPLSVPKTSRTVTLSEFGGYSLKIDGHVWSEKKIFGYRVYKSREALERALEKLYLKKLLPLIGRGLSACIYTQVSDVEEEVNGLFTYDRKVTKVSSELMRRLNESLYQESEKYN